MAGVHERGGRDGAARGGGGGGARQRCTIEQRAREQKSKEMRALGSRLSALCSLLSALCSLLFALCSLPSALCPLPSALPLTIPGAATGRGSRRLHCRSCHRQQLLRLSKLPTDVLCLRDPSPNSQSQPPDSLACLFARDAHLCDEVRFCLSFLCLLCIRAYGGAASDQLPGNVARAESTRGHRITEGDDSRGKLERALTDDARRHAKATSTHWPSKPPLFAQNPCASISVSRICHAS